jgi:hypothetical protein
MTKQIRSYSDLQEEKLRLRALLKEQKQLVHHDIQEIKAELAPVRNAISFAGKMVTRDTGGNLALNVGANALIDLVVKKFILGKAGWLAKTLVPFLLKNYSSHVISDNKDSIFKKLFSWIGKKRANGKVGHEG